MAKAFLKKIILLVIKLVERYEYRATKLDEDDVSKKILNSIDLEGIRVKTDSGWQPIQQVHITQPYRMWRLTTGSGKTIDCADNHRVFTLDKQPVFVKDLKPGMLVYTVDGYEPVTVVTRGSHSVSMFDITVDHPDHRYYSNGILSHNTVTSSIFIAWYLCFHYDRNVMVVANKLATTSEIVDKIRIVMKNLPFFMKPGIQSGGVTGMRFDNGNRLFSQATTKTAAIGFTIHLLFADEFAHIHPNFLLPFYRSIYPTLSSSKVSRMIVCSTPNGMNLFYEIYQGALQHKNAFHAIRVDWWQVPGRDEDWKKREIANLGNEELFNQEYGNQFLASSRLLLPSSTLQFMKRISKDYVWREMEDFIDYPDLSNNLKWHPDYDPNAPDVKKQRMVFAVDIGDGVGRDFSVVNIFRLEPQSPNMIRKTRDWTDETSFFRLRQVGMFRSNNHSVEELSKVLELLTFETYHHERVKIVMEINFKGNLVYERMSRNTEFYPEIFLYTRHSVANETLKLGVKIQKDNKESFARELRTLVQNKRVVITEKRTFEELSSFGINNAGRYESQLGNDDVAMSCINLVTYFSSNDFYETVEDMYETVSDLYKTAIEKRMDAGDGSGEDAMDVFRMIKNMDGRGIPGMPSYNEPQRGYLPMTKVNKNPNQRFGA